MKKILIVDDEAIILDSLQVILESKGYKVETAPNGECALKVLNEVNGIDMVITDYKMPGMNGVELARHISTKYGVPTILLTGTKVDDGVAAAAGITKIFSKPVRSDELLKFVES